MAPLHILTFILFGSAFLGLLICARSALGRLRRGTLRRGETAGSIARSYLALFLASGFLLAPLAGISLSEGLSGEPGSLWRGIFALLGIGLAFFVGVRFSSHVSRVGERLEAAASSWMR